MPTMAQKLKSRNNIPFLLILIIIIFLYFRVFFYIGYVQWGNFGFPLSENIFNSLKSVTWNPYLYNGMPVTSTWTSLFGNLNTFSIIFLGGYYNINIAVKLYVVISTLFMVYSFYIFIGRFTKSLLSRSVSSFFILLNPLTLQFIGAGDFFEFIIFGIFFLSLTLLSLSIDNDGNKGLTYMFLSILLLSCTVAIPQLFYLGIILYIIFIFYFEIVQNRHKFVFFVKKIVLILAIIILLSMPLILTTFFGVFNLSPNSSFANPLSNFIAYSSNFFNLLKLNSNPFTPITLLVSGLGIKNLTYLWILSIDVFVIIIMLSGIILMDKRILFFSIIILLGAIFGSDYLSPVSFTTVYFYEHIPGYQVLNTSYYWEWIVIMPLYAVIISILLDRLFYSNVSNKIYNKYIPKKFHGYFKKYRTFVALFILVLILFILITPLIAQGYYGPGNSGIHQDNVPESYNKIPLQLKDLIGNTNVGVAYFTPDNYVYFGNSHNGVSQPLLMDPGVRSPGMISYGAPPVISNYYFYFAYREFYLNETHNIAQIMGLAGVKYFVTLNNVTTTSSLLIANNVNSTKLMDYQNNITLLYSSDKYSIYMSTLNIYTANGVSDFTIMPGNYNSLLYSSKLGINLSNLTPVFFGDINSGNFNFFLNHTKNIILFNSNDLTSLALSRYINGNNSINLLNYTDNYDYSISQGWLNSRTIETSNMKSIVNNAYPFAITGANKAIKIVKNNLETGNYYLWAYVLTSNYTNSKIKITVNNQTDYINTYNDKSPGNFTWVKIPFNIDKSSNIIKIRSFGKLNGIERLVFLKAGMVSSEISYIKNFVKINNVNILNLSSPNESIINKINSNKNFVNQLYIKNNPNGYEIYGNISKINIVRYGYFNGMITNSKGFKEIPVMNGLDYILISGGHKSSVTFVSRDYYLLIYGLIIYFGTISFLIYYIIIKNRLKRIKI